MSVAKNKTRKDLNEQLTTNGFRFTRQRQHVYDVLLQKRDHPTAEEIFIRTRSRMPGISIATVYNCLDALVHSGLVRQVTVDRGATRFCPNMQEHCHFYCEECDSVFDVELPKEAPVPVAVPKGFKATRFDIAIHGICPGCAD
jgi:Fur family peroxide stress response transcriptional regulator